MKKIYIYIGALMSLSHCVKSNEPQILIEQNKVAMNKQKNNDEAEILALSQKLTQLMIERDTEGLGDILDEGFTLTHITGYVQSRAEWFAEIECESMKYYSAQEVKNSLKIEGDKAVFVQRNLLDARIWGTRNVWRLQQILHLEKRNNQWVILNSVAELF